MTRRGGRLVFLGALAGTALAVLSCKEDLTAPGKCPDFCPTTQVGLVDTVLPSLIVRDSSFGRPIGYVNAMDGAVLIAATLPGVDSRPIFVFPAINPRLLIASTDTTTGPVLAPASVYVRLTLVRRDTAAHNLTMHFYRLAKTIDTATSFADVADSFSVAPIRSVNIDTLLAKPGLVDTVTRDSVFRDTSITATPRITFALRFDSLQIPWTPGDSGVTALGIRITADAPTSAAFSSSESGAGPGIIWNSRFDSAGTIVIRRQSQGVGSSDGFVFTPPAPPLDSNLTVGGVPSVRSLLRVDLPRILRDSTQIVRATLLLVPAVAAQGAPRDSFRLLAVQVLTDLGAKSPLTQNGADSTTVVVGQTDTVRIEVTNILRLWQSDSIVPHTILLRQATDVASISPLLEGATLSEIRFYSSRAPAYRPALHLTYIPRYRFGAP